MRVGRQYRFRASHSLPDLPAWSEVHGHVYTVVLEGEGDPPYAVDMEAWDSQVDALREQNLDLLFRPSTVEQIATQILARVPNVKKVTVWEDDDRWATAE